MMCWEKYEVYPSVLFGFVTKHIAVHGPGSVVGIAACYGLDGLGIGSPWGARFSAPILTGPVAHPAFCTMGTGSLPGIKSGWVMTLTTHHLLVLWSRKGGAIPVLPLWAIRPVQSLSACTRVTFTFNFFTLLFRKELLAFSYHFFVSRTASVV